MGLERVKHRAEGIRPSSGQPLRKNGYGSEVWHGVTGNRFGFAIPDGMAGPIRARDRRRAAGLPGHNTYQEPAAVVVSGATSQPVVRAVIKKSSMR